jgi:hypothetical protein
VLFHDLISKHQKRLVVDEVCVNFSMLSSCLFGTSFHWNSAVYFVSSFLEAIAWIWCGPGMRVTQAASYSGGVGGVC